MLTFFIVISKINPLIWENTLGSIENRCLSGSFGERLAAIWAARGKTQIARARRGGRLVILGIDPGYAIVGFGVIRHEGGRYIPLEYGAVSTPAETDFSRRLESIYDCICQVMEHWRPKAVAVEKLFF